MSAEELLSPLNDRITFARIEIARRHMCELCRSIWPCHLCDTRIDHTIHKGGQFSPEKHRAYGEKYPIYVCEDCAEANKWNFLITPQNVWDYETGHIFKRRKFTTIVGWYATSMPEHTGLSL